MTYFYNGWEPYGAADMHAIDQYVDYGFSGNALEEALKMLTLKQLTENTAVVLNQRHEPVAYLVQEGIGNRYGLSWPGYDK